MKRFLSYYKPYKNRLALVLFGAVATALAELLFPLYLRYLLNDILPLKDISMLLQGAVILLCMYIICSVANYYVMAKGRMIGALIERDMRRDLFNHVEKLSFSYFDNQRVGQLVSRIVSDIGEIREIIFLGPDYLIVCTVFMLGTVIILFAVNWKLAVLVNLLLIAKTIDSVKINRALKQAGRQARKEVGNMTAQVTESLNAIRLVQSFNNQAIEDARLNKVQHNLLHARKRSFDLLSHSNVAMAFFSNITNLAIVVAGGVLIALDEMQFSDLVTFLLYVSIFIRPVLRLNVLAESYQKAVTSFQRFEELMEIEPAITDSPDAVDPGTLKGDISFQNITFGYDKGDPVIKNVSLDIKAGQSVAFVGSTGSGKSTLCSLLPRFYEPQEGRITIDGTDITHMTLESLRRNIGTVQQDIFLFSDTVNHNIAYGKPLASQDEIIQAAKLAEADSFIEKMSKQYESELGERGVKLSGGQKQRIAIARVFLKNPPILILDEATSALDNETEKAIQQSLNDLSRNRTTLVVAHRLATIRNVDNIVVLGNKGIVEQGSHEELLQQKGEYYRLYMAQFTKEEKQKQEQKELEYADRK